MASTEVTEDYDLHHKAGGRIGCGFTHNFSIF